MQKIIFIDRDGVINVDPIGDYIKRWEDFKFEKGALEALKGISRLGFEIILISNQAGVGDGIFTEEALNTIHENMVKVFKENGINYHSAHYCLHGKQAGCSCRKPQIGLFEKAAKENDFAVAETFFIGDKATDMEAGKKYGLKTIFLRTGHGKADEAKLSEHNMPDYRFDSFPEVLSVLS